MNEVTEVAQPAPRPSLLFLCQTLPFPPDGGVNIRTYNVLRLLAREFDITALCFFRKSDRPTDDDIAAAISGLSEFAEVEVFPIPQEHSAMRLLWDHLRSLVTRRVYTLFVYESDGFHRSLDRRLKTRPFDLVHVDSLDLAAYLPDLPLNRVVCTHHNVESKLLERRARHEDALPRRVYLELQANLMAKLETQHCSAVALNVAVSDQDAADLRAQSPGARVVVVPNGVDPEKFRPSDVHGEGLVFVGGSNWFPNRDALAYFAGEILPRIRERRGEVRVVWVGRSSREEVAKYGRSGIELTGYVDDVRPFVRDAACYVVPLRVGGGTRLKILDAWAMGKAIVSTARGCEGLEAVDGENILLRDDAEAFAHAVCTVLDDDDLRTRLGREGRITAVEKYSWDVIGEGMVDTYRALASRAGPPNPSTLCSSS